jgi:hypothetical protein
VRRSTFDAGEQLALQHQARLIDILTAFAADLAAEQAYGDERFELRSGVRFPVFSTARFTILVSIGSVKV